jgi:lipopolysaccharide heptosyltransferase II
VPVFVMKAHPSPAFSVIIPSRDGSCGGNVPRLLEAVGRQERAREAEVLLVVGERPNGHARNVGVDASRGRWLVFMDDDAGLLGCGILTALLAPLEETLPGAGPIGMTGTSTALPDRASRFQRRVAAAMPRALFPEVDQLTDTDMAHHLCCAIPRTVYEEIGRESDDLETGTDVDLRNRLRAAGYRIVVVPHAVATHPQPDSLAALWNKNLWYGSGKVRLHGLYPPAGRDVIRGGRWAATLYAVRALATFPIRTVRLDRASAWNWNPLRATADLAQKLGYARAYRRNLAGLGPASRDGWLSSRDLERRLRPRQATSVAPPSPARVRRLLVVNTAGLGDAVTMLPMLQEIRRQYGQARITAWVSREGTRRVLERHGVVDETKLYPLSAPTRAARLRRKAALLLWLRRRRFELGLVNFINSSEESAVLLRLAGIPHRAGYVDDPDVPSLFNLPVAAPPMTGGPHSIHRHLALLPVLGLPVPAGPVPRWRIDETDREAAGRFLAARGAGSGGRVVGIHPGGGSDMPWKRWPPERFAGLADLLARNGARIWIFGGRDEAALAGRVRSLMQEPALDLTGAGDLGVTAALLSRCDLLVSNDTGLYNVALSLPIPVVALFGPTLPWISGPWETGAPAKLMTREVPCHPCIDCRRPPAALPCPIGVECLRGVEVDGVLEACRTILGRDPGRRATDGPREDRSLASPPGSWPAASSEAG